MNEPPPTDSVLPGLEAGPGSAPAAPSPVALRPRVKPVDRSQLTWQMLDVERLIEEDHPARAIWGFVGKLNLDRFYGPIEAVEGAAGRTPWDPRLLVSLWIYAYSRGIRSAPEISRRCTFAPGFTAPVGRQQIDQYTLSA